MKEIGSKEGALLGVSSWTVEVVHEDIKLSTNECSNEYNSLGTSEWDSEVINDGTLIGFRDKIIEGDIIWASASFSEFISDGVRLENSEGVTVVTYDGDTLILSDSTLLGVGGY